MDNQRWENGRQQIIADTPLTFDELSAMICGFISYPTVYKSALQVGINPAMFNGRGEHALYVFMTAYSPLQREHGTVTKNMFVTNLRSLLSSNAVSLNAADHSILFGEDGESGLIALAFVGPPENTEETNADRAYVQSIVRRFLNARLVNADLKNLLISTPDNTAPAEMATLLDNFRKRAQAVKFVGHEAENAAEMPERGSSIILPPIATPTTISWIDNYIGGFRAGDVIGLLGPYAGGKTTMLSTIGVRMARQYAAEHAARPDSRRKIAVYICYEDGAAKMNWSFYSAAAHIHRDRFKNKVNSDEFWNELSTRDNLYPYERQLAENRNGEVLLCERERWDLAQRWFNNHFAFLDFSANAETNYRGNGGVLEIVATLENLRDRLGADIGVVLIDYLSLMLNRFLAQGVSTKYMEQIWRQIQSAPDDLKTHVAVPFNTTVFVAHQLAQGDIKNIPPFRYVSHADAQGSKAFGENVHACLCLNRPDPETYVSTIHWSKIRFDRPTGGPYGLVKIDENVVDVWQADDDYYINDVSRKIMRRGEMDAVADPSAVRAGGRPGRRLMNPDAPVRTQPDVDAGFLS